MGIYTALQTAFDTKLATVVGIPKIVKENDPNYQPVLGTPYCLGSLMPAQPSEARSELGVDGATYFLGLYQVLLVYPRAGGAGLANVMADKLMTSFARGTIVSASGLNITVRSTWRNPAISETAWWSVPVMISWYCLTKI